MVFKGKYCGLSINLIFLPLFRLELGESEDRIKLRFLIWGFLGVDFGGKGRLWLDRLVFCFCVVLLSLSLSLCHLVQGASLLFLPQLLRFSDSEYGNQMEHMIILC